ncbi:MAG: peptide ABC transporter substrate-binding protein [Clostridia bacterium]|nr:peptide ABC transporter substrate-binding protein [Clostridia bacterium]
MRKPLSFFLCLLLLLFAFSGCKEKRPKNADKDFYYILTENLSSLDPQTCCDENGLTVLRALFDGLTRMVDGKAVPAGAEEWSSNADSTVFTFTLREDRYWRSVTDNDLEIPVTADDFVFAFRRAVSPETKSRNASLFFPIRNAREVYEGTLPLTSLGVEAAGKYTLLITLDSSFPDFPKLLAHPAFSPCCESFFNSTSGKYGLEPRYLVTNGPFVFESYYAWEPDAYLNLLRNAHYESSFDVFPASITFTIDPSAENLPEKLAESTVCIAEIQKSDLNKAQDLGLRVESLSRSTCGLCFNLQDELMQYPEIRRAFAATVDRKLLSENLPDRATLADNLIPPDMTFREQSYRSLVGERVLIPFDSTAPQAAAGRLSALEYDTMPSVSVFCADDDETKTLVNQLIISWNREMGNYFNMNPLPEKELRTAVAYGNYQVAFFPVSPSNEKAASILDMFSSQNPDNPTFLNNESYDALLGRYELGAMLSAEKYLSEQAVFYPICYESGYYAFAPGVSGITIYPYRGGIDFTQAVIDEVTENGSK